MQNGHFNGFPLCLATALMSSLPPLLFFPAAHKPAGWFNGFKGKLFFVLPECVLQSELEQQIDLVQESVRLKK